MLIITLGRTNVQRDTRPLVRKTTFTPEYDAFCRLLIEAREEAGLSQHQLAKRLHTRQDWVSRYEAGQRRLDMVQVWRICRAIGIDPVEFMRRLSTEMAALEGTTQAD